MEYQTYPVPTELPALREGTTEGRYMDCTSVLAPVGDFFPDIGLLTVDVSRIDGIASDETDLFMDAADWPSVIDTTGKIVTFGWRAPPGSGGRSYLLTLKCSQTAENRVFARDWIMSVLPTMG